jgi:hypothetical protein
VQLKDFTSGFTTLRYSSAVFGAIDASFWETRVNKSLSFAETRPAQVGPPVPDNILL